MSANIAQIYLANPANTLVNTDLMYLGRSPYGSSDNYAFLFSTLLSYVPFGISTEVTTGSQTMIPNVTYTANNASLVTLTLPTVADVGTFLQIVGLGAGGWTLAQNASQLVYFGNQNTTAGTGGSISSSNQYDNITLKCVTANLAWSVVASQGTLNIV